MKTYNCLYAMMHDHGYWDQMYLSECLELVKQGKAYELPAEQYSHYDDDMRSFERLPGGE